jgi:hypothetical protein
VLFLALRASCAHLSLRLFLSGDPQLMKRHLFEFVDHKIVRIRKGGSSNRLYMVPTSINNLKAVLDDCGVSYDPPTDASTNAIDPR